MLISKFKDVATESTSLWNSVLATANSSLKNVADSEINVIFVFWKSAKMLNSMKYFIVILLLLAVSPLYSQFSGGDGSPENPFLISSLKDLKEMADSTNTIIPDPEGGVKPCKFCSMHYKLTRNIRDSVRFCIAHRYQQHGYIFDGVFDGQGYKITLAIADNASNKYFALFSIIGKNAIIKNLVVDGYVKTTGQYDWASGIVSWSQSESAQIINCVNLARIESWGTSGIAGRHHGLSEGNINLGTIIGRGLTGGVIGGQQWPYSPKTINCLNSGFVRSTRTFVDLYTLRSGASGIVGAVSWIDSGIISNSLNVGVIETLDKRLFRKGIAAIDDH